MPEPIHHFFQTLTDDQADEFISYCRGEIERVKTQDISNDIILGQQVVLLRAIVDCQFSRAMRD